MRPRPQVVSAVRRQLAHDAASVDAVAAALDRAAGLLSDDEMLARRREGLIAELNGVGPLEPLLGRPGVTDVLVNAADEVFIDQGHGLVRTDVVFRNDDEVRALAVRLAAMAGRRLDDARPFVDAQLPDGTRLHAILPPLVRHPTVSLRVLLGRAFEWEDLIAGGTLDPEVAAMIRAAVDAHLTILVTGGAGTGKTTFLGALIGLVSPAERVLTIEDVAELDPSHPHVVGLLTRLANVEGAGGIEPRELVRQALRMRPDRIFVGEFRGSEVVELLAALNTGHCGGGATVHANGIAEVPARLEALAALGGVGREALGAQAAAAIDLVVHLVRAPDGQRRVAALGWMSRDEAELSVLPVWTRAGGAGPASPLLAARLPGPWPGPSAPS